ncbi:mitogen activated protein kinase [Entophlyctis helioformis]|nr:mitogen activated protein kinase [Entophlyctis helioformis]
MSKQALTQQPFVSTQLFGTLFELPVRYSNLEAIGMGSFGLVCSAIDTLTNERRAIKKVSRPFQTPVLAKRAFRELMLLKHLRHDNVIGLTDVILPPSQEDLYFITELLGTDLHRLLSVKTLEPQYIQYFAYQILRGLKYVHSAGVVHRDLKPGNILINENCDLKICDFGLARVTESMMTGYVSTRYYRAPEIMLTWQRYDKGVDVWSMGCILAEMIEGKPLFPGKDHIDQFSQIMSFLGSPPEDVVNSICSENTLQFVRSLPPRDPVPFARRFSSVEAPVVDLLSKTLVWDAKKRITAEEALNHPYFASYHDEGDEPEAVAPFDWSFTEEDISASQWLERVVAEVQDYRQAEAELIDHVAANGGVPPPPQEAA